MYSLATMISTIRVAILVSMGLAASLAMSQSNYAMLSGTVLDPQNHPIPQVDVLLTSIATHSRNSCAVGTLFIVLLGVGDG